MFAYCVLCDVILHIQKQYMCSCDGNVKINVYTGKAVNDTVILSCFLIIVQY